MPHLKLTLKPPTVPWTKLPNNLIDRTLPTLRDTELRILLVVLRYTTGWRVPRDTAFLTYRRLSFLTGRQSEAIARALFSLERAGHLARIAELSPIEISNHPGRFDFDGTKGEDYKQIRNKKEKRQGFSRELSPGGIGGKDVV